MTARYMGHQPVITKNGPRVIEVTPQTNQSLVRLAKDTVTDLGGSVLGTATAYMSDIASKSAGTVEGLVVDSTVTGIVKQVDKLPKKQQEDIRKALCK